MFGTFRTKQMGERVSPFFFRLHLQKNMTDVYHRAILTHDRPPTPTIVARLHPFVDPPVVEHWEPGRVVAVLPAWSLTDRVRGDVVFGASDGENVYVTGYVLHDGTRKNTTVYRDGGTMEVQFGVPTKPGAELTHLFALAGRGLLSEAVAHETKKIVRLSHAQVLWLFRDTSWSAFRTVAPWHARRRAMAAVRRVRSRRTR